MGHAPRARRARHDGRLRRPRHRSGRAPDQYQAGLRRQHRLGDHGRDDAAARDVRARMFEPLQPSNTLNGEVRRIARRPSSGANTPRRAALGRAVRPRRGGDGRRGRRRPGRRSRRRGAPLGFGPTRCGAGRRPRRLRGRARLPQSRQLGLLGRSVAPRLYVAVETEGDFEHAVASVKADVIVVFKSSAEPVTGTADVAVAGDWRETPARLRPSLRRLGLMLLHVHEWGDPAAPPPLPPRCMGHGGRFRRLAEERLAPLSGARPRPPRPRALGLGAALDDREHVEDIRETPRRPASKARR